MGDQGERGRDGPRRLLARGLWIVFDAAWVVAFLASGGYVLLCLAFSSSGSDRAPLHEALIVFGLVVAAGVGAAVLWRRGGSPPRDDG